MGPRLKVSPGGVEKDGIELMTPFYSTFSLSAVCLRGLYYPAITIIELLIFENSSVLELAKIHEPSHRMKLCHRLTSPHSVNNAGP